MIYILREKEMQLFQLQKVQSLYSNNYTRHLDLLIQLRANNPRFPALMLFIDEVAYTRKCIFNIRHEHTWAEQFLLKYST